MATPGVSPSSRTEPPIEEAVVNGVYMAAHQLAPPPSQKKGVDGDRKKRIVTPVEAISKHLS